MEGAVQASLARCAAACQRCLSCCGPIAPSWARDRRSTSWAVPTNGTVGRGDPSVRCAWGANVPCQAAGPCVVTGPSTHLSRRARHLSNVVITEVPSRARGAGLLSKARHLTIRAGIGLRVWVCCIVAKISSLARMAVHVTRTTHVPRRTSSGLCWVGDALTREASGALRAGGRASCCPFTIRAGSGRRRRACTEMPCWASAAKCRPREGVLS